MIYLNCWNKESVNFKICQYRVSNLRKRGGRSEEPEQSLRDLCETIKHTNTQSSPRKEREKSSRKSIWTNNGPNFWNLMKYVHLQIEEATWTPSRMNSEIQTYTHHSQIDKIQRQIEKHKSSMRMPFYIKETLSMISSLLIRKHGGQKTLR